MMNRQSLWRGWYKTRRCVFLWMVATGAVTAGWSSGQLAAAPNYQQTLLRSVYPAGGGQGQTVEVTCYGNEGGIHGAKEILIDGPPGISVGEVTAQGDMVKATLHIAEDAVPGRRMVRVKGGVTGLTNYRWFVVSALPEVVEQEKNNSPESAEDVALPVVVNGRVDPTLDQDCFGFEARAGQHLTAAVLSHWIDAMGFDRNTAGFSDVSLELLDERGRVLAESGDTLGFDPLIEWTVPADGRYVARVSGMGFRGFNEMVYRLTLGEVPYATAVFPPGGRRGEEVELTFSGPSCDRLPPQRYVVPSDPTGPGAVDYLSPSNLPSPDGSNLSTPSPHHLPFVRGDLPERTFHEAPVERGEAPQLELPVTVNARFLEQRTHWYRVHLDKASGLRISITAQQHLRSPVDTLVELFDAAGESVAKNDDGEIFGGEVNHEFQPFDSFLEFQPKQSGDYWIAVSEQSGALGPRAVYRMTVESRSTDFRAFQWPDAVPVWGPGSSAGLIVETHRLGGFQGDIELSVEGLPEGWKGSTTTAFFRDYRAPRTAFGHKSLLTITAPDDADVGTMVTFDVVARATLDGKEVTRTAEKLTHYLWQEPNRFRVSPVSRVVVAKPQGVILRSVVDELTAKPGEKIEIPVIVEGDPPQDGKRSLSINRVGTHFRCSLGPPVNVNGSSEEVRVPLEVPEKFAAGEYWIVVADSWASETRKGLPGPCTPLIRLTVSAPESN